MKTKDFTERLWSIKTQKKFGTPNELGNITLGVSYLGEYNPMAGIYRLQVAPKYKINLRNSVLGFISLGDNKIGTDTRQSLGKDIKTKQVVRMKHYVPFNPQSVPQQNWRNYFATVLSSWQAMSENEKDIWRKKRYPAHMSGWNRYAKVHLKARDL